MKTKLLLLFFVFSGIFSQAQIQAPQVGTLVTLNITATTARLQFNVNYYGSATNYSVIYSKSPTLNPAVGQTPNGFQNTFGWQTKFFDINGLDPQTTYYWRVTASNGLGVTQSVIASFTTLGVPALPLISNVSSSAINNNSAKINYTLKPNHAPTTSVVKYGLASNALTNQVTGLTGDGAVDATGQVPLTSLVPLTTYYYQIDATNSVGTVSSAIGSFATVDVPAPLKIAEYNFDNTYNNINGSNPFAQNAGTSFVTDRNGNANSAININNTGSTASIPGLPYENAARTVSLWVKTNTMNSTYNMVFSYGQGSNSNAFGASYNATVCEMFGYNNNLSIASANANNTWYHFVYTYDGTNAKIYKNGALLTTVPKTWNTLNSSNIFKLGIGVGNEFLFNGAIDDLQIYNYALGQADITSLYTNNTLASQNFNPNNLEVSLYPNPTKEVLNIQMTNEVKTVEIFNLQGQKVLSSNQKQINTQNISAGIYLVNITDTNNNKISKKIIKK